MNDYVSFWNDLNSISSTNPKRDLKTLFEKYNLLTEDGYPRETIHFELKRWSQDLFHDSGIKNKLVKHAVAMANTITKNPFEIAILVIGIDDRKHFDELPYDFQDLFKAEGDTKENKKGDDVTDAINKLISRFKSLLRENTVPQFPSDRIDHFILSIPIENAYSRSEDRDKRVNFYPVVFFRIPVELGKFYGIKISENNVYYCLEFPVRQEKEDKTPESIRRSWLNLFEDVHKKVAFDLFTVRASIQEPRIEIKLPDFIKINDGLPFDIVELHEILSEFTLRDRVTFMDYLKRKGLIKEIFAQRWGVSFASLLLFGSRNISLSSLTVPEAAVNLELEESYEEEIGDSAEFDENYEDKGKDYFSIFLIPLRKAIIEILETFIGIINKYSLQYDLKVIIPPFYETLINAIIHMNYYSQNPQIKISLSEKWIRIENPTLWNLTNLSIQKLTSSEFPKPNRFLYDILKDFSFLIPQVNYHTVSDFLIAEYIDLEKFHRVEGLDNLIKYLLDQGLGLPDFKFERNSFSISLPTVIDESIRDFFQLQLDDILKRKNLSLSGRNIRTKAQLKLIELVALHVGLFEETSIPEERFNQFFDADFGKYKEFVKNIEKEIKGG